MALLILDAVIVPSIDFDDPTMNNGINHPADNLLG